MARPTRLIYVENDPTLRGMLAASLQAQACLELLESYPDSDQVLASPHVIHADVALLDLALGPDSLTGTEIALLLRERNPNIGIVIFSQHVVPDFVSELPEKYRWGWSMLEKRGDIDIEFLVDVLRATARGLNVLDPNMAKARTDMAPNPVAELTPRQREIMALVSGGIDASAAAAELGLAAVTVRQELSRAYAVLVPDPKPGTDLRTSAVLRYLRETRGGVDIDA